MVLVFGFDKVPDRFPSVFGENPGQFMFFPLGFLDPMARQGRLVDPNGIPSVAFVLQDRARPVAIFSVVDVSDLWIGVLESVPALSKVF